MAKLFQSRYRIKSVRLENWNYNKEAAYFVTICTKNRDHFFGEIINGEMQLSEIGKIAYSEWFRTMEMRPDMNLQLGEFVVMPNHIHGIIIIGKNETNHTETNHSNSITPNPQYQNQFAPQSKNLSSIIRGYKSAVTTSARKNQIEFNWQTRFHEHIIRSTESFERISEYIVNNPIKWKEDRFNPFEGSPK